MAIYCSHSVPVRRKVVIAEMLNCDATCCPHTVVENVSFNHEHKKTLLLQIATFPIIPHSTQNTKKITIVRDFSTPVQIHPINIHFHEKSPKVCKW